MKDYKLKQRNLRASHRLQTKTKEFTRLPSVTSDAWVLYICPHDWSTRWIFYLILTRILIIVLENDFFFWALVISDCDEVFDSWAPSASFCTSSPFVNKEKIFINALQRTFGECVAGSTYMRSRLSIYVHPRLDSANAKTVLKENALQQHSIL